LYEKVEKAIKHLEKSKSSEADNITAEMIKAGGTELTKGITKILKQCWSEGKAPE